MTLTTVTADETLFLDDSGSLLNIIYDTIKMLGIEKMVYYETTIKQAREKLKAGRIKRVVSDWKLEDESGHDGVDFLQELKKEKPDLDCTLLTGFAEDLGRQRLAALTDIGVHVLDKEDLDTETLRDLLEDKPVDICDEAELSAAGSAHPRTTQDIMTEQRLRIQNLENRINALKTEMTKKEKVVFEFSSDLLEDLRAIEDRESLAIIGPGSQRSVNDVIREIENQTPEGIELLRIDRLIHRKLRQSRKSRLLP